MLKIYCKLCGSEVESHPSQLRTCSCKNAQLKDNVISGYDLSKIEIISNSNKSQKTSIFSQKDLEYQENRRKRKVSKLTYEIR